MTYRALESNMTALSRQKEMLLSKILEIQSTIMGLDEIGKSDSDILNVLVIKRKKYETNSTTTSNRTRTTLSYCMQTRFPC